MTIDAKSLLQEVKDNHEKLKSCPRHEFVGDETRPKFGPVFRYYKCSKCGGSVDFSAQHWYVKGLEHASK